MAVLALAGPALCPTAALTLLFPLQRYQEAEQAEVSVRLFSRGSSLTLFPSLSRSIFSFPFFSSSISLLLSSPFLSPSISSLSLLPLWLWEAASQYQVLLGVKPQDTGEP